MVSMPVGQTDGWTDARLLHYASARHGRRNKYPSAKDTILFIIALTLLVGP